MGDFFKEPEEGGWGGPWTEKKLAAFIKYVRAYHTIMNKYPFWKTKEPRTLFDNSREIVRKVEDPINRIAETYIDNMSKIWDYVTPEPLKLNNTRGVPLFHFVFASNNKHAMKIASDIIKSA